MAAGLEVIFASDKMLAIEPTWAVRDGEALEILCPLEIDGTVVEDYTFELERES